MTGQHVNFVDDEHLVAIARRFDVDAGNDHLAHILNLGVRRGVNLEHVHRSSFGNLATRGTRGGIDDRAGSRRRLVRLVAIQRARNKPCRRRLANAPRPGKKIRVMQAIMGDRILQCLSQDFLARYVFKFLRAPLTGNDLIGHKDF